MQNKKIDWVAAFMVLIGVAGILYFTSPLHWYRRAIICFSVSMLINGLRFFAGDTGSQKQIKLIYILFVCISALVIGLHEVVECAYF